MADRLGTTGICVSVHDWHKPRAVGHRRGTDSPNGYVEDAFDDDGVFLLRQELRAAGT